MNSIIALAIRWSGLGMIWEKIDGFKSKIGASGLMLAGAGMMLSGIAAIISAYVGCADHACQVDLFRTVMHSDNAAMIVKGFITFKGGLLGLGLGHKLEKAADAAAAQVAAS